jgi:hypothetical protein
MILRPRSHLSLTSKRGCRHRTNIPRIVDTTPKARRVRASVDVDQVMYALQSHSPILVRGSIDRVRYSWQPASWRS